MLNKYKYFFCFMVFAINLLLVFNLLLAAEKPSTYKSEIVPYIPPKPSKHYNVSEVKARLIQERRWLAYKAFKQGNSSICDSAVSPEDCWTIARSFAFIKALTTGDCSNVSSESSNNLEDFCKAVYRQDCSSLSGYKKTMCEALQTRNTQLMIEAYSDLQFPAYKHDKKSDAEFFINIYYGFKNKGERDCDKFTTTNLLAKASCNMIFGNQGFEKKLDGISQDIIYTLDAKESGVGKSCDNVKDESIKTACQDNSVRDLNDILRLIWN